MASQLFDGISNILVHKVVNSLKSLDLWISNDYRDTQKNPLAPVGAKGRDAKGRARTCFQRNTKDVSVSWWVGCNFDGFPRFHFTK